MNKELEVLALKILRELQGDVTMRQWEDCKDFASRFLAAVQAQQEPVAWYDADVPRRWIYWPEDRPPHSGNWTPLYAFPPAIPEDKKDGLHRENAALKNLLRVIRADLVLRASLTDEPDVLDIGDGLLRHIDAAIDEARKST